MLDITEAESLIRENTCIADEIRCSLGEAAGAVLREDVAAEQ